MVRKNYQGFTGAGLEQNVREAYGFLCNNFDDGDEIHITGFSRGAFTARSVAGMVDAVGILTKKGLDKFYEAFEYYKKVDKTKIPDKKKLEEIVSEKVSTSIDFLLGLCRHTVSLQMETPFRSSV